jgi:hypothetical protein
MPAGFEQCGQRQNLSFPQGYSALLRTGVTLRPRRRLDARAILDHIGYMYGLNQISGICREIIR